ncbi:MAG: mismatch repair protein MutS [Bacteroidetes bacterium]|nr:mismatch repair protein MutS [Bacteroidota bacterium]
MPWLLLSISPSSQSMLLYPSHTLEKLEFDKIRILISHYCRSEAARDLALALEPMTEVAEVRKHLLHVHDYRKIMTTGSNFPLDYVADLSKEITLLGITDAVLDPESFTKLKRTALSIESIFRFFTANKELYPHLESIVSGIYYEKEIVNMINAVFDENMIVKDNASKELMDIRSKLSKKRSELNRVFNHIIQRYAKLGILTDSGQSIRNGRKVVSIVAESKRQQGGIIHDESDSGKTVFMEPKETVELNNEIFEFERAEEREVYRILKTLTAQIALYKQLIESYQSVITKYDLIQAKSKFANDINASYPVVSDKPVIYLRKAVHPLLYLHLRRVKKETIPLTIRLDDNERILVISGPNAGGKTITLKTIGLLQIMLQSGLHVPVDERSEMGVFQSLFVDIGDSQSIEDELSTYSSHLRAMRFFIDNSDKKTLFLIDEFGTGSDPALGGAFAEAILEELAFKRAYGVVTTHYLNLKIMANKVKGIVNGAMIFNEETLMPTYQLTTGKPGSSYTFAIAERTGLPRMLIERAKELVDTQHYQLDHLLNKVEQEHQLLIEKEKELTTKSTELSALKKNYEELLNKVKITREKQTNQSVVQNSSKTTHFIREAERRLQKLLKDWETRKDLDAVAAQTKQVLKVDKPEPEKEKPKPQQQEKKKEPVKQVKTNPGMKVKVLSFNKNGVIESVKGNKVTVIIDDMRMTVSKDDLVNI